MAFLKQFGGIWKTLADYNAVGVGISIADSGFRRVSFQNFNIVAFILRFAFNFFF